MPTPKGLVPVTQADEAFAMTVMEIAFAGSSELIAMHRGGDPTDKQIKALSTRTYNRIQSVIEARADALAEAVGVMREAREQIVKYSEFFCEEDYDPLIDRLTAFIAQHEGEA